MMLHGYTLLALGFGVAQAPDGAADGPPMGGAASMVIFYTFLVVMLVVPVLMAWNTPQKDTPMAGKDAEDEGSGSFFSSDRERRLWLWTLAVMFVIYVSLGPVEVLAAALRERNLLRISTAAVLVFVVTVLAVPWAKRRPGSFEIGAALGIAAVYLAILIRMPVPEARSHLFEYGVVAMLIYQALSERRRNGRHVPMPALFAVIATALLGWLDEGIQALLPNRVYDLVDVGFNALAGLMAVLATLFIAWARSWDVLKRVKRAAAN